MTNTKRFLFMIFILNCVNLSWGRCDPDVPSRRVPTHWTSNFDAMFKHCVAGTYLDLVDSQCEPCPTGYFMTAAMAHHGSHAFCEKCYELSSHEKVAEDCTPSRDSTVSCQKGYFRRRDPSRSHCKCSWQCAQCGVCVAAGNNTTYEKQSCSATSDTVCCSKNDMVVEDNKCVLPNSKHFFYDPRIDKTEAIQLSLETAANNSFRSHEIHLCLLLLCYLITDVLEYFL